MTEESDMVPPLTEATRARMVLAAEAAEVADKARSLGSIDENELRQDGTAHWATEYVAKAATLVAGAQRVLNAAAVFARCNGESWPQIGGALNMTKQSAQERFDHALARLHSPENPDWTGYVGQLRWRLHPAARAGRPPGGRREGAAQRPDEWLVAHYTLEFDDELADHPVSGGLTRMDATAELRWIADHGHRLRKTADAPRRHRADRRAARPGRTRSRAAVAPRSRAPSVAHHPIVAGPRLEQVRRTALGENGADERVRRHRPACRAGLAGPRPRPVPSRPRVGRVGMPRTVRQGEQMVMVMHGRAGAVVHLNSWSTKEPPLQAVLCDSDHVQTLDLLDEISPWLGSDLELVTKEMRAEE